MHVTPGVLRGKKYVRMLRDVYLLASVEPDLRHWIAAWRLKLGPDAVLSGLSAAFALGVPWFADAQEIEMIQVIPERARRSDRLRVRGDILLPDEVDETCFGITTSGPRTAYDLARRSSLPTAVAAVDAVLRATGTKVDDLRALVDRYPGARWIRQARLVADLADPRAESLPESRLRVALLEAGVWGVEPQYEVHDQYGRFVARLDLANAELKVGWEYEGSHHRERDQYGKDLIRYGDLDPLGWKIIRVDADQMRDPLTPIRRTRRLAPQTFSPNPTPSATAIAEYREEISNRRRTRREKGRRVRGPLLM